MKHRYTIVTLRELLAVARMAEAGFGVCAETAPGELLRELLLVRSQQRAQFASELRSLIELLGGDAHPQPRIPGAERGWLPVTAAVALRKEGELLDACERGEDHALEVYRNALDDHLPDPVRQVVMRQFEEMMSDHDQLRLLRIDPQLRTGVGVSVGGHAQP